MTSFYISDREAMESQLLLSGNEAVARAAWEVGVDMGVGYPGTPSTETLEALSKLEDVYTEWSPNEKVALEVAAGASFAGSRVLVTMKHVGLNVAADPLMTLAYTGVNGGLVILVADDPGMHSSQNEQDSHNYAGFAGVIMLDPADPQEAYDMTKRAFEISESHDSVVIVRSSVRVAHTKQMVSVGERKGAIKQAFKRNPAKWIMMPAYAKEARIKRDDHLATFAQSANCDELNRVELADKTLGIICSGVVYTYVKEALPEASILKLGITNPLPQALLEEFAHSVERVVVAEEADSILEREIRAAGIECEGLSCPRRGELTPALIRAALGLSTAEVNEAFTVAPRPPMLCSGCPHRPVFYALKKMGAIVTGDIGCYTLGAIPPLEAIDTCVCMGASVSMAHGLEVSRSLDKKRGEESTTGDAPVVGIIGDSTFAHSGITGVVNTVYNAGGGTIVILDNRITAMTGHQGNPVNGITLQHRATKELELEPLLRACGVDRVRTEDPNDLAAVTNALKEETSADEFSVIIFRSPCILLTRSWPAAYKVDVATCRGCKVCTKLGCPAIEFDSQTRKAHIDEKGCRGCGLCEQVCDFGAISCTEGETN